MAAVVTGLLFALAHGVQDVWLFGDRLAFGLVASWLAWRTGGLEAPIALHIANNLVSLVYSAATGSLEESLSATELGWEYALLDLAMMVVFALLVARLADRWHVRVRREAGVAGAGDESGVTGALSGRPAFGYPDARSDHPSQAPSRDARPGAGDDDRHWGMG